MERKEEPAPDPWVVTKEVLKEWRVLRSGFTRADDSRTRAHQGNFLEKTVLGEALGRMVSNILRSLAWQELQVPHSTRFVPGWPRGALETPLGRAGHRQ